MIEWRVTGNDGKTPSEDRVRNPRKRNAADRCRSREEIDGGGCRNRNVRKNCVSIAELSDEIRERNNQRDTSDTIQIRDGNQVRWRNVSGCPGSAIHKDDSVGGRTVFCHLKQDAIKNEAVRLCVVGKG